MYNKKIDLAKKSDNKKHISTSDLYAFQKDQLSFSDLEIFLEHIASCDYCSGLLAETIEKEEIFAPFDMKANILNQTKHIDVQATKSATSSSKKMKLFRYSLKVITASAAAIVLLILTFKLPNPSYEEIDIPTPIIISDIEQEATLASSIRSHMDHISNQILNFSNNIINMEVIKNDKKEK